MENYTIKKGDTLGAIAKKYNISVSELAIANNIENPNKIKIGQALTVPKSENKFSQKELQSVSKLNKPIYYNKKLYQGFDETQVDNKKVILDYHNKNKGEPFLIVDKNNNTLQRFDENGNEVANFRVGVGSANKNDKYTINSKNKKIDRNTTPAGIYYVDEQLPNESYQHDYENNILLLKNERGMRQATSIHQIPNSLKQERTNKLLNADLTDDDFSNGCINCTKEAYEKYLDIVKPGTKVYILPEEGGNYFSSKGDKLQFTTNRNKEVGQYNFSPKNTKATPFNLTIQKPTDYQSQFLNALTNEKESLMKDLNLSSGDYDELAKRAYGIFGQESSFGEGSWNPAHNYKLEELYTVLFDKPEERKNRSLGLTQIRMKHVNPDFAKKHGINEGTLYYPYQSALATMERLTDSLQAVKQPNVRDKYKEMTPDNVYDYAVTFYNKPETVRKGEASGNNSYVQNVRKYYSELEQAPKIVQAEVEFQKGGLISKLGYKRNSPYKNRKSITIDSNLITMDEVDKSLLLEGNNGQTVIALPNSGEYYFPNATKVKETPIRMRKKYQQGGLEQDILSTYLSTLNEKDQDSFIDLYSSMNPQEQYQTLMKCGGMMQKGGMIDSFVTSSTLDVGRNLVPVDMNTVIDEAFDKPAEQRTKSERKLLERVSSQTRLNKMYDEAGDWKETKKMSKPKKLYERQNGGVISNKELPQVTIKGKKSDIQTLDNIKFDSSQARTNPDETLIVTDINTGKDYGVIRNSDGSYRFTGKSIEDFFDKHGNRVSEDHKKSLASSLFMAPVDYVTSLPQAALTYLGTEGKEVLPSKALDVENKWGALATDVVLDPLNVIVGGSKLSKINSLKRERQLEKAFRSKNIILDAPIKANTQSGMEALLNRDGKSVLNYTENPDKIYRTITQQQLDDILNTGKLRTPAEASIKGKNNFRDSFYWYKGHASDRYGKIAIEAPNRPYNIEELIFHVPNESGVYQSKTFNELNKMKYQKGGSIPIMEETNKGNVEVEGKETVVRPNGQLHRFEGPSHANGGIDVFLEPGSRVYSEHIKAPNEIVESILGKKTKKKYSYADLSKKFPTKPYTDVLSNNKSDEYQIAGAEIKLANNQAMLDTIFAAQEMEKANKETKSSMSKMQNGGNTPITRTPTLKNRRKPDYTDRPNERFVSFTNEDIDYGIVNSNKPDVSILTDEELRGAAKSKASYGIKDPIIEAELKRRFHLPDGYKEMPVGNSVSWEDQTDTAWMKHNKDQPTGQGKSKSLVTPSKRVRKKPVAPTKPAEERKLVDFFTPATDVPGGEGVPGTFYTPSLYEDDYIGSEPIEDDFVGAEPLVDEVQTTDDQSFDFEEKTKKKRNWQNYIPGSKLMGTLLDIGLAASDNLDVDSPNYRDNRKYPIFSRFVNFDDKEVSRNYASALQEIQNSNVPEQVKQTRAAELNSKYQDYQAKIDFANAQRYQNKLDQDTNKLQSYMDRNIDQATQDLNTYREKKARVNYLVDQFKAQRKSRITNSIRGYLNYVDETNQKNQLLSENYRVNPFTERIQFTGERMDPFKEQQLQIAQYARDSNNVVPLAGTDVKMVIMPDNSYIIIDKDGNVTKPK